MTADAAGKLRVVFMGTPDFAVAALRRIVDSGFDVVAVYSQPPRPKGRGQHVQCSPVHEVAAAAGIPVYHPLSLKKDAAARAQFAAHDADVAVVAAYGLILPQEVLDAPRLGCLNIHASLLPRWRGASPIQHAIWKGDAQTGVSIMQMEAGLDTGPVLAARPVEIRDVTTAQGLHDELAALGGALIVTVLERLAAGETIDAVAQDDAQSVYAPLLRKEDGMIDWTQEAAAIDRQVRALNPWPGVWTRTGAGARVKILEARVLDEHYTEPPGTLVNRHGDVACGGDTGLRLLSVQPENARAMDLIAAVNGGKLRVDDVLG